jgi:DNA-directed RNA polymerase specialized sigma24 family protein
MWKEPLALQDHLPPSVKHSEPDRVELGQAIKLTMRQLPDRDRELLRLFFVEERDRDEICQKMGMSLLAFRVALCRVKKQFRKIYKKV